jgi:hypothetical protein
MFQYKPTIVVIPTYWTWGSECPKGPLDAIYDHPTPLDDESTLPRLLQSLTLVQDADFAVLVLTAVTHPELEQPAADRVAGLIAPFRVHYPIAQATEDDAAFIRHLLSPPNPDEPEPKRAFTPRKFSLNVQGFAGLGPIEDGRGGSSSGPADHVQMRGYAGVRNLQLLLSHALGAEAIVALDDDEVVAPDYLQTALHCIGREREGKRVLGLAGLYLDADGGVMLPQHPRTGNIFLDKSAIMNKGTRALQRAPGRLVDTPVAFGGNMVFHRDLFTRVGFDPGITRGEDIDYLINARLAGYRFWLDKELLITHLPPETCDTHPYARLTQDVYRFIYEWVKLQLAGADPAQFDPYPGRFLRDDVATQALAALEALATPEAVSCFGSPQEIVAAAKQSADENFCRYLELAAWWPDLMESIEQDTELRERLLVRFDQAV